MAQKENFMKNSSCHYSDEEDQWSELSPERSSYESDEDYYERMQDLEDYGDSLND